jgi:hypothetical protein
VIVHDDVVAVGFADALEAWTTSSPEPLRRREGELDRRGGAWGRSRRVSIFSSLDAALHRAWRSSSPGRLKRRMKARSLARIALEVGRA